MSKKIIIKILLLAALMFLIAIAGHSQVQAQISNLLGLSSASNDFILSWSTDSYIPSTYEGKALPTRGSEIKVVALPVKKLAQDPDKLYYRWLLDGEIMGWAYGVGKSIFQFKATGWPGSTHEVESQILDEQEKILSRNFLSINIVEPEVLLTKTGDYLALKNALLAATGQEIKLVAIPLFFHIKNLGEVNWQWTFAGQVLYTSDEKDPNSLVLKIPSGKLSQILEKNLSVNAINKEDQYQQASVNLSIQIK